MCLVGNKRAEIARVVPCENNFCTKYAHHLHFCGLQKLNTLNLRHFHPPLNPCNHFSTVLIKTNWYTISCKYYGCSNLISVSIPNSLISLGGGVFAGCSKLTSLTIPNSVESIGDYTFFECSSLTAVSIPNSVTNIGEWAFGYCRELTTINFPNNLTNIGIRAFYCCSKLTSVTIPSSVIKIDDEAFGFCDLIEVNSMIPNPFIISTNTFSVNTYYNATLYVPKGSINKYKETGGWSGFVFIEEGNHGTGIAPQYSQPYLIKAEDGIISIKGTEEGTIVCVYTIDGVQDGAATIRDGAAMVNTNVSRDSLAIVKIGNKRVKVVMR